MRPGIVLVLWTLVYCCEIRCNTGHNSDTVLNSDTVQNSYTLHNSDTLHNVDTGHKVDTHHNIDTVHNINDGGTGVLSQYTDLPYPPYTRKDEMKEREYYVKHTDCIGGVCHLVSSNNTDHDPLVFSLEPDLLNSLLYEVVRMITRQYYYYDVIHRGNKPLIIFIFCWPGVVQASLPAI